MGQQTECTRGIQPMLNENHYLTFSFLIKNMCLLLGVCAWRHGCLQKPEVLGSLELELQVVVSQQTWVWGIELGSSTGAVCTLDC